VPHDTRFAKLGNIKISIAGSRIKNERFCAGKHALAGAVLAALLTP
jgi:hypothetical protein